MAERLHARTKTSELSRNSTDSPICSPGDASLVLQSEEVPTYEQMYYKGRKAWARCWMKHVEPQRDGALARFMNNAWVRLVIAIVVVLDCIFLTIETDVLLDTLLTPEGLSPGFGFWFKLITVFLLVFYTIELLLNLAVHRLYFFINENWGWNIIDFFLVLTTCVALIADELEGYSTVPSLRWLRLLRIFRGLRTLDIGLFARLNRTLNSMKGSFESLVWSLALLALILYLFATIFLNGIQTYLMKESVPEGDKQDLVDRGLLEHFGSTRSAVLSLYMAISGGEDWNSYYGLCHSVGLAYGGVFLLFMFVVQIAVVNIITSQFVEHAMSVSQHDRELQAMEQRRRDIQTTQHIRELVEEMDLDKSGKISKEEFDKFCRDPQTVSKFRVYGLDIRHVNSFLQMLAASAHTKEVPTEVFIRSCMKMKGNATSLDMQTALFTMSRLNQEVADLSRLMKSSRAALDGGHS